MDKKRIPPQDAQKVRPTRPQLLKKAEVEVKVKRRSGSCLLNLSLSLNLPIKLANCFSLLLFRYEDQHPRRALFGHVGEPSCSTAGGKSREDRSPANLNGAETIEGSLRRMEGKNPRNPST